MISSNSPINKQINKNIIITLDHLNTYYGIDRKQYLGNDSIHHGEFLNTNYQKDSRDLKKLFIGTFDNRLNTNDFTNGFQY